MKFGFRIPSIKKRAASRISWKRYARHSLGFKAPKGFGVFTNPKRAVYNYLYRRTTFGVEDLFKNGNKKNEGGCLFVIVLLAIAMFIQIYWIHILLGVLFIGILWLIVPLLISKNNLATKATSLFTAGKKEEAIELLESNINETTSVETYDLLASFYGEMSNYDKSIQYFKILLTKELDSNYYGMICNKLCGVYLKDERLKDAETLFESIAYRKRNLSSNMLNMAFNIANVHIRSENRNRAIDYLNKINKSKVPLEESTVNTFSNNELKSHTLELLNNLNGNNGINRETN